MSSTRHNDDIGAFKLHKQLISEPIFLHSLMKSINSAKLDKILSLLSSGVFTRAVASQTDVKKSKVALINKKMGPDKKNLPAGCPPKLSATDKRAIIIQINTGKAENAVQVAKNINTTLPQPVCVQTAGNTLKK